MRTTSCVLLFLLGLWTAGIAPLAEVRACSVPVFRYALERWEPDPYTVLIFHKDPISGTSADVLKQIRASATAEPNYTNIEAAAYDVTQPMEEFAQRIWDKQKDNPLPWMVVLYPVQTRNEVPLWAGAPSSEAVKTLLDSPMRREIGRRLLKGDSAVWVLLESSDKEKNEAAAQLLEKQVVELQKKMQLPELAEEDKALVAGGPELKIGFSWVRLKQDDPEEALLRTLLKHTEADLPELDEPMAFAVFGRGRALPALVGKGVSADNLEEDARFLCGACSCQVKQMNPGTDLLLSTGWTNFIQGEFAIDEALPPLIGLPENLTTKKPPVAMPVENDPTTVALNTSPETPLSVDPETANAPQVHISAPLVTAAEAQAPMWSWLGGSLAVLFGIVLVGTIVVFSFQSGEERK